MPLERIANLLKEINTPSSDDRIDKLLEKLTTASSVEEINEALVVLFTIIDTNHKKNQQILVEIVSIILLVNQKIDKTSSSSNSSNKKSTSKTSKLKSIIFDKALIPIGIAIGIIFIIGTLFILYKIDPKTTDKAIKGLDHFAKPIQEIKGVAK